jgi:hypothetical protein
MRIPRYVAPEGNLTFQSSKVGLRMGNRGKLGPILLQKPQPRAANSPWITCVLKKDGRSILPKIPDVKYTKLFFLDEVTAFAAGHRPCSQCQPKRYDAFVEAWLDVSSKPVAEMNEALISECCNDDGSKKTFDRPLSKLPSGVMFRLSDEGQPHLVLNGRFFPWTDSGYERPVPIDDKEVQVLTPSTIFTIFQKGLFPLHICGDEEKDSFHPSVLEYI